MSDNHLALPPDALRSLNRWHLIIGTILLLLLFLLPALFGIGPSSWRQCAAPAVTAAAPAPIAAPAPAAAPAMPAAAAPAKAVVYFDTAKYDVKALVAKAGATARYAISGFHDSRGDPVANAELAKNRAFAVRDVLKANGVAEDRIEMRKPQVSAGSDKLADDPEARRVEVSVEP
jgi:K(+)-stimulated pyrophosphate-energized sodium pump